jgi:hypothetical protein
MIRIIAIATALVGFITAAQAQQGTLNDKQIDNLVRRVSTRLLA